MQKTFNPILFALLGTLSFSLHAKENAKYWRASETQAFTDIRYQEVSKKNHKLFIQDGQILDANHLRAGKAYCEVRRYVLNDPLVITVPGEVLTRAFGLLALPAMTVQNVTTPLWQDKREHWKNGGIIGQQPTVVKHSYHAFKRTWAVGNYKSPLSYNMQERRLNGYNVVTLSGNHNLREETEILCWTAKIATARKILGTSLLKFELK